MDAVRLLAGLRHHRHGGRRHQPNSFIGTLSKAFLAGIGKDSLTGVIPESVFVVFQMTFAIITAALITGAVAERMKFSSLLVFITAWLFLVYVPIAHMVWSGVGGLFWDMGVLDFTGGTVVHINAGVAGLVAVTPAAGFVGPVGALIIGLVGGVAAFWGATSLKRMLGYDDSLDAFGVHGVAGIVGAILTGFFAVESIGGVVGGTGQVVTQIVGVAITVVYVAVLTFIILKVIDMVMGLRVSEKQEREGLDTALHGERVE
ncbi:MAG: ammonium transporter [Halothiobacillaceae bacterium]